MKISSAGQVRPRVGLVGFFGWGNFGDELFLREWHRALDPFFEVAPVHDLLDTPYFSREVEDVAAEFDAFVIGGGDLVIPNKVSSLYWNKAWLSKKVYIAGIGVPTWIRAQKPEVVRYLQQFFQHPNIRYISARDKESADWIEKFLKPHVPVEVHPDLVFATELPEPHAYPESFTLGVAVRQRRVTTADDYTALRALVDEARNRGYAVKALVLGTGRTGEMDLQAAQRLPFHPFDIVTANTLDEICAAIGGLDVLASMKFHGSLVAAMYGVPSIVLSPTTKSRNLYKTLGREDLLAHLNDRKLEDKLDAAERSTSRSVVREQVDNARDAQRRLVQHMRTQLTPLVVARELLSSHPRTMVEGLTGTAHIFRREMAVVTKARIFPSVRRLSRRLPQPAKRLLKRAGFKAGR